MKTVKSFRDGGFRFAIMSMLTLFVFTGCYAHPSATGPSGSQLSTETDSVMRNAVGDSIYRVITEAKKIKSEMMFFSGDSVAKSQIKEICIKSKDVNLILFVLSDPKLYGGDIDVYGAFMPSFTLTFSKKKEMCVAKFDFGLHKWAIYDSKGRMLNRYDLLSDNMLRLANILFPENDLFKKLINSEKK